MILNKQQIIEQTDRGNIVYHSPLGNEIIKHCNNQSVDVHIGDWIYIPSKKHREILINHYNSNYYLNFTILTNFTETGWIDIERYCTLENKKFLTLPEGIFFLAYTEQYIGTIAGSNIHPKFYQRSTIARLGLFHPIAGWGDVGYFNRWCMEFKTEIDFDLYPNMRVGQIVFEDTHVSDNSYIEETGNYQASNDIKHIFSTWKKEDILPKNNNI